MHRLARRRRRSLGRRLTLSILTTLALIALPAGAASRAGLTEQRQGPLSEHLAEEFALQSPFSVATRPSLPRRHLHAKQFCEAFSSDDLRAPVVPAREREGPVPEQRGHNGFGGPLRT